MEEKTTVVIDIKLDEGDVAKRLGEVNQKMDALKKGVREMKSENAALVKSNEDLKKAFQEGAITLEDMNEKIRINNQTYAANSEAIARNEAQLKTLKAEQSMLSGQVAQATAKNREYGTSIKEQSALLNDLRNRYQSLNEEQRNSEGGKEMLAQIQSLDKQLKDTDATLGLFQRNVGDYANQIVKALGMTGTSAKGATTAIQAMGNGMKAVVAIPIVALLSAIVFVAAKVTQAIKGSEEKTMQLRQAFAALNPLIDAVKRGFEAFAGVVVNIVTKSIDGLTASLQWVLDKAQSVGNFFGADWHMGDNFRQGVTAARELQKAEDDYIKAKRKWSVESAKIDRDVADLREKASDKEKYNAKERIAFLDEAIALETKKAQREKELAEQNLKNLQAEAQRSENAAAMNDRLAEAERAVINADKALSDTKRTLNRERQRSVKEINGVTTATNANTKAIDANRKAIEERNEAERQAEEYRRRTVEEMRNAEDAINELIKDGFDKREAMEQTAYKREKERLQEMMEAEKAAHGETTALYRAYYVQLEAIEERHSQTMAEIESDRDKADTGAMAKEEELRWKNRILMAKQMGKDYNAVILQQLEATMMGLTQAADESDEAFFNRRLEAQAAYLAKRKEMNDEELKMERDKAKFIGTIAGSISDTLNAAAKENEDLVRASKVVALAEVAIKQGVAIAEAVASAAAGDPYTYALRVAAAVASTVAAMAQAISAINSSGYAQGGVVGGFKGVSMGADNTRINARSGEMILNGQQQKALFEAINGGVFQSNAAAEIVAALNNMPAPVMDYQEFVRFGRSTATITELQKLK